MPLPLIRRHGVPLAEAGVFVGELGMPTGVRVEVVLLLVGAFAVHSLPGLLVGIAMVTIADLLGTTSLHLAARTGGVRLLHRILPTGAAGEGRSFDRRRRRLRGRDESTIFVARLLPLVRMLMIFGSGLARMRLRDVFKGATPAALLCAGTPLVIGYAPPRDVRGVTDRYGRVSHTTLMVIPVAAILGAVVWWVCRDRPSSGCQSETEPEERPSLNLAGVPIGNQCRKVLIFTGAAGGGHVAAARAVGAALERAGHEVTIRDGLVTMSRRLNWVQVDLYARVIARAPRAFGLVFRALGWAPIAGLTRLLVGVLWGDRLRRVIEEERPDAVVSTFPTVTAGLGRLRRSGWLGLPVTAVVTDHGAHPLWISPHVDRHLVPSRLTGDMVRRAGGRAVVMTFPTHDRFPANATRIAARTQLGLPADAFVPLIVGGAWGIGAIEEAAARAVAAYARPIVVTGRNEALRRRLERRFAHEPRVRVLGWTGDLPLLMAAADCLIQHAGGVTCLEALAVGLPIVFFRPLPGHGRANARAMAAIGAARVVDDPAALERLFRRAGAGAIALVPPPREAGHDVVDAVLGSRLVGRVSPVRTHGGAAVIAER